MFILNFIIPQIEILNNNANLSLPYLPPIVALCFIYHPVNLTLHSKIFVYTSVELE